MTLPRRRDRPLVAVAVGFVCLVLTGCGGSSSKSAAPELPTSVLVSASSGSRATTASADPDAALKRLIVSRYVLFVRTMDRLGQTNDISSAALRDVATGNQLIASIELLTKDAEQGITVRGQEKITATSLSYLQSDRRAAVVLACGDGSTVTQYKNGKPLPRSTSQLAGVKATMNLVSGTWKVAGTQYTPGSCPS